MPKIETPARRLAAALPILLALGIATPARAGEYAGNLNFILGQKVLNEGDWEPIDDQPMVGVEYTWGFSNWPIHIATDVILSSEDGDIGSGVDADGSTAEMDLGVREIREHGPFRWSVGAGLSLVKAEVELEGPGGSVDDDDVGFGGWLGGGIFWRLGSRLNLGVSARYSKAEVELFDADAEAGGFAYGALVGFGWPATR